MFNGQTLIGGTSGPTIYSPWFARQGDYLKATAQIVSKSSTVGGDQFLVEVMTKNREDAGNGTAVTGSIPIDGNDTELTVSNTWGPSVLKELVRFRFTVSSSSEWWVFRMLDNVWFDAASA